MTDDTTPAAATGAYNDPAPFAVEAQGLSFTFFPAGKDRRTELLRIINGAKTSLKIAFYIFVKEGVGQEVRDALCAAAKRGVHVSLIVDGFGSDVDDAFFEEMTEAGGTFCVFMARWSFRALIRNHQKIVVADDAIAMLGGFNVEDDYFAPPDENGWNDIGLSVQGPVVARVSQWFDELHDWARDDKAQFKDIRRRVKHWDAGEGPVQLLIGGPTRGLSSWAECIKQDLAEGERLDMMMAYFSPSRRLRKCIRAIARKGRTTLVMAGKSDNNATIGASRALYEKLLEAGARIYEFQACKLHTKLIVLDDAVYIGSANFDMRSLYVNLEIMLKVEDAALAERMREFIRGHLAASDEITAEAHAQNATAWCRVKWWASWFLVSVVDYTVSRKLNLGL
ncbi:cardiolipin synthase B [Erythrobacter arachoides]|uniref:Phospholipase D n=1 Tax=Aurantiacibacter arachoides TaxID=1850444 RepID=A0A844ZZ17_9SPHN|nr:cardiolipin synthase B [Aurantiacibacter arachoides]MXO92176.1 cardiolipin synthase B [Aurantiacibacter arachoides]GGD59080.1 hypothetical protein GCM10011411_19140 [Aurantiacibacter arachoides]